MEFLPYSTVTMRIAESLNHIKDFFVWPIGLSKPTVQLLQQFAVFHVNFKE